MDKQLIGWGMTFLSFQKYNLEHLDEVCLNNPDPMTSPIQSHDTSFGSCDVIRWRPGQKFKLKHVMAL